MFSIRRLTVQLQSVFRFQANRALLKSSILSVISRTVKRTCKIIHRLFGSSVDNSALASSAFPPSYEVATSTPPPYNAIYTLIQSDIHTTDTVEPAPLYSAQYTTPLDDIGMAGFTRSGLATIFEEDAEDADDTVE
ncbi:hypothetical protein IW261DRAFT_1573282 [Armillaria novae-zelandiae]|nr:hypothetical protein IW261DRAFT_1573282 [Armillaria novae-zelandiae]